MTTTGRVRSIRRYPVKSLLGEEVDRAVVENRGLAGDRLWAVRDLDGKLGSGKSTRRFRKMDGLLDLVAAYDDRGTPVITLPDGRRLPADALGTDTALSQYVGRPVTLGREAAVSHFDEGPLHLVTTASLEAAGDGRPVDPRRTRANLVLEWADDGFPEHGWVGRRLAVGPDVVLRVTAPMPRCVMVDAAQAGLPSGEHLLRRLGRLTGGMLGVVAEAEHVGTVSVGDTAVLLPE
ncbi:MAG TPA: MOSC N-terminal beta barrel domain-containing protein [Nocardioidaceae bacterium]